MSIRKDIDKNTFVFPQKVNLLWKLKDFLEENIEEKYYLSEKGIGRLIKRNNKIIREMENPNISACIISNYYKLGARDQQYIMDDNPTIMINEGTKKGYTEATIGDSINISYPFNISKRGRVGKGISNTITTSPNMGTMELFNDGIRIRRLTPLECWRLMGFYDDDYYKAKSIGISDTQLYRQAR